MLGPLGHRPLLLTAAASGVAAAVALWLAGLDRPVAVLLAWCLAVLGHAVPLVRFMMRATPEQIRRRAEQLDEGETAVLLASLGAAMASLVGVVWVLASGDGAREAARVTLALVSILLSWGFVHLLFAVRYAHEYWQGGGHGLDFPGDDAPAFGDFLYVAFTIGMTFQTSDVAITSRMLRRLALGHAVVAFLFSVFILSTAVNITAGLVR